MKKVTVQQYNKAMDKIISLGLPVNEALIALIEEASKYKIVERVKTVKKKKKNKL